MTATLKNMIQAIHNDLAELEWLLRDTRLVAGAVAELPVVYTDEEHIPVHSIQLTPLVGREAITAAAKCFRDVHIVADLSRKVARRTIGALHLAMPQNLKDQIVELVARINDRKLSVEEYVVRSYKTPNERFRAIREADTGIMTLHLYRKIRLYVDTGAKRVSFTWQNKDSVVRVNKKNLLARIAAESLLVDQEEAEILQTMANIVASTPEHLLRERRKVRLQPAANIVWPDGMKTVTAPMPILFIQQEPIHIHHLRDYQDKPRKMRTDKAPAQTIGTFMGSTIQAITQE